MGKIVAEYLILVTSKKSSVYWYYQSIGITYEFLCLHDIDTFFANIYFEENKRLKDLVIINSPN